MGTDDQKINMAVTFQNHYGALMLKKRMGDCCSVRAVPRSLSSSCGTCAMVDGSTLQEVLVQADLSLLEGVYQRDADKYRQIYG